MRLVELERLFALWTDSDDRTIGAANFKLFIVSLLWTALKVKYSALINRNKELFKQDIGAAHRSRLISVKFQELEGVKVLLHPYDPDVASSD